MRNTTNCRVCMVFVFLAGTSLFAQTDLEEADHEALRNLKTIFEDAVNRNQIELIEPYLDSSFSVVTFTDREFTDFETFKQQWSKTREAMLKGGTYSIKLLPVRSHILGDVAIARGDSENIMTTGSGETFTFTAHWTAICRKTDGEWKILRGHNSLDPFGNPMLKSGVKKIVVKVTAITAIISVFAGLLCGCILRRRRNRVV